MAKNTEKAERLHKATYASDKRSGGYNVRVVGPQATRFAGREVPVTTVKGDEHMEKLIKLLWSGVDTGTEKLQGTNLPVALYSFLSRPKDIADDEIPF